jgi:hypothetical protein
MKTLIRSPLMAVICVAMLVAIGFVPQSTLGDAAEISEALVQTSSAALATNRGDVIKQNSALTFNINKVTANLALLPSTTIKRTGENTEATFTINAKTFTDVGLTNGEIMVNTTTAATVANTATISPDVGFVSESLSDNLTITTTATAAIALCADNDAYSGANQSYCASYVPTTTITGANIRAGTMVVALTVDRETQTTARTNQLVILQV